MSYNILLNSSNVVGQNNNTYKFDFIKGSLKVPENSSIAISQVTIPYSWYNVTSLLKNNTFSYTMPTPLSQFTGAIAAGTTSLIVSVSITGLNLAVGMFVIGTGVKANTFITSIGVTAGGLGTYTVNQTQVAVITAITMYAVSSTTSTSTANTVLVTLPDGFYLVSDINNALNKSLYQNGYYFYNTNPNQATLSTYGTSNTDYNIIYPIQLSNNYVNYTNNITLQYIPTTSANVNTQFGAGWTWMNALYPVTASTPQFVVLGTVNSSSTLLGNILGLINGSYPSAVKTYASTPTQFNSNPYIINGNSLSKSTNNSTIALPTFAPMGSTVNGIVIRCSLCDNDITMPSDILDSFSILSSFGSNINYSPIADNFIKMKEGIFNNITISLYDQNLNPLIALDSNVMISLLLKLGNNNN